MLYKQLFFITILLLPLNTALGTSITDSIQSTTFGKVLIFNPNNQVSSVVIFVSGDGGMNQGAINIAKNIADMNTCVAAIDINVYLKHLKNDNIQCNYPAGDFENLAFLVQRKYKFKDYLKPIVCGYSSGATLVYGALAQAPANTFKGAIALGFDPELQTNKPLCPGSGKLVQQKNTKGYGYIEPVKKLMAPLFILQGDKDLASPISTIRQYIEGMLNVKLIELQNVGHGFSYSANWVPQCRLALLQIEKDSGFVLETNLQPTTPQAVNMPVIPIRSKTKENFPLVLFISGDGGWTGFDASICNNLATKGINVIGIDAQKYFWNETTPKATAADFSLIINKYLTDWQLKSFVLIGYSFGACVAPCIANNFSTDLLMKMNGVFCLSPDVTSDFEIHIADMINLGSTGKYNVIKEIKTLRSVNTWCIFGNDEDDKVTKTFEKNGIPITKIPGNHHYNNNFETISKVIINNLTPRQQ